MTATTIWIVYKLPRWKIVKIHVSYLKANEMNDSIAQASLQEILL